MNEIHLQDKPIIEIKNANKYFGDTQVLFDINLSVHQGEKLFICGPSGSGKSTLIRCVNTIEKFNSGVIKHFGEVYQNTSSQDKKIRKRIGMVFQQYNLFPHLTVLENLTLAPIKVHNVSYKKAHDDAIDYLKQTKMDGFEDRYPYQLSGGQQQRIAIARCLCTHPEVILLDEPTSALDPEMIKDVLELIENIAKKNYTVICVTHEMNFAKRCADRVIFMDQGKIIEQGTPEQFFNHPKNERLKTFIDNFLY